jgi:hypothetical protein
MLRGSRNIIDYGRAEGWSVMMEQWLNGPVGMGAEQRVLRHGCRTVLVVVPFVVAGTRLMDVLPLLEADHRILTVFTVAPASNGAACHGVEEFLRAHACLVLPWQQAVQYEFDLVLAASPHGVAHVRGKSMLLPHGAGAVRPLSRARSAGLSAVSTHDLDRESLLCRGRLIPDVLALSHDAELGMLGESCPEALPVATVAGDICYDRLLASIPFRAQYRRAFGLTPGQKLVVVSSTWQPESTLGRQPDLVDRVVGALPPDRYRVATIVHPNTWSVHGGWQVRAWFADSLLRGMLLLPPEDGWRAGLVAADLVVGDYGSVTRYGAAIGVRVMVAPLPEEGMRPDPVIDALRRHAPALRPEKPLLGQISAAMTSDRSWQEGLATRITSRPGQAGAILRSAMYRLLGLAEPARAVPCSPVPLPRPVHGETAWWKETRHV